MIHSISSADKASKPCLSRRPSAARKFFTIWTYFSMLIEISPFRLHQVCPTESDVRTHLSRAKSHRRRSITALSRSDRAGSDLRHASIDGEVHTGDVRTFIGSKEHDCCRDFLGHASATHWDLCGELCDRLLGLFSGKARRRSQGWGI